MAQHTIREGEIFIFDFLCFVGLLRQLKNTDRGNVVEYKTEIIVEQIEHRKNLLPHLLLLFLKFFVLHLFELRPEGQHLLLELCGAQLIDIQHQRELDILRHKRKEKKDI